MTYGEKKMAMITMTYGEKKIAMINETAEAISKFEGYKVLKSDSDNYFFVITPQDNIIYIQCAEYSGMNAILEYLPSSQNGSGCRCNDEAFYSMTPDLLILLERNGLAFAKRLGAKLYRTSNDWFDKYWDKDSLKEIKV